MSQLEKKRHDLRKGVVLLAVLVVIAMLALGAYHYSDLTLTEYKGADHAQRQAQARALAESGIHFAAALLSNPSYLNGNPYYNPNVFGNVAVTIDDKKGYPGKFSLLAPPDPESGGTTPRVGVTDEGGKINLNALMEMDAAGQVLHDMLMKLPNMTEDIADSIVDWLDSDNNQRTVGAEDEYYSTLSPPYRAKNGPLESLEELLLVKGVTPQLLFGNDRNRNGVLDSAEQDGTGILDRGWSAYLTIYSREQNVDTTGQPLANINDGDLGSLYDKLTAGGDENLAKFIVLYRQYGPASASTGKAQSFSSSLSSLLGGTGSSKNTKGGKQSGEDSKKSSQPIVIAGSLDQLTRDSMNLEGKAKQKIKSLFDLINARVSVPSKDKKGPTVVFSSPIQDVSTARLLLPALFDLTTTSSESESPARININTAPREVLTAIPNMTDTEVQTILAGRPSLVATDAPLDIFHTLTWLYTEAGISSTTLKKLEKYITTRTQVYRVQVTGSLDVPGPSARVEAVIDVNGGQPRFLSWRELTELGK